jgi:hypothetical protein
MSAERKSRSSLWVQSIRVTSTQRMLIPGSGYSEELWDIAQPALSKFPNIVASVIYADGEDGSGHLPLLKHVAGPSKQGAPKPGKNSSKDYHYPKVKGQWFSAGDADFDYAADSVAHTRNLQFLKPKMGGPYFDLEEIWEEHTYYEFADRSVEHTMSTMVQEPYVNHIPTVSGSVASCLRSLLTDIDRSPVASGETISASSTATTSSSTTRRTPIWSS